MKSRVKAKPKRQCLISSAVALSASQQAELETLLTARFTEPATYRYQIDPKCLGGLRVQTHDWFFDATLAGRLDRALTLFLSSYAN